MALSKSIMSNYGIPATYWRIATSQSDYPNSCTIQLDGYVSKEARSQKANPVERRILQVEPDLTRQQIYDYLKTTEEFADSVDA